jgi:hypothetical protein
MDRACGTYGLKRRFIQSLGGKPEKNRTLVRPRRIWKDDIKMDLQKVRWGGMDWIDLAQ